MLERTIINGRKKIMDNRHVTAPFTPTSRTRKINPTRKTVRATRSTDGQLSMQYFIQVLDNDSVCRNALHMLKRDNMDMTKWIKDLNDDEWKYKFDIPILTKY